MKNLLLTTVIAAGFISTASYAQVISGATGIVLYPSSTSPVIPGSAIVGKPTAAKVGSQIFWHNSDGMYMGAGIAGRDAVGKYEATKADAVRGFVDARPNARIWIK